MERVRLRPDVTDADGTLAMRCRRQAKPASPGRDAGLRTHSHYDVTDAYSLYATLVFARDASPLGAGSIGGSTSNLGASDGAITPRAPNIFVMWKAATFVLGASPP